MAGTRDLRNQLELFDSPLSGKVKGQRNIMAFPFFDLSRSGGRKRAIEYDDGKVRIRIKPGPEGMATIYDKDLILYCASLMVEKMNAGLVPGRELTFTAHDFMRVAGRDTSKRSYENLEKMLARLQGTQIKTNIEAGGVGEDGFFSWIESGRILYTRNRNGEKVMRAMKVTLCEWLYRAILRDGKNLTYHNDYFRLAPLERRLYDMARSHCIDERFVIGMEKLRVKVGSDSPLKKFKFQLKEIVERQSIPEYEITLLRDPSDPVTKALRADGYRRAPGRDTNKAVLVVFTRKAPRPAGLLGAA